MVKFGFVYISVLTNFTIKWPLRFKKQPFLAFLNYNMINQSTPYPNIALKFILELPGQSCELFSVHGKNTRFVYILADILV
jgi:hypothetical protein